MLAETAAALTSLRAAYEIAKGMQALHTSTEVKQATSDMLDLILSARSSAVEAQEAETALQKRVSELESEIARLQGVGS
jgi:hypothetical protein